VNAEEFLRDVIFGADADYVSFRQTVVDGEWTIVEPRTLIVEGHYRLNDEQVKWLEGFWAKMDAE
jgi:hypothetical protein